MDGGHGRPIADGTSERTGVLVIRVWHEESSTEGFSARITRVVDLSGSEVVRTVATEEALMATVQQWLADFRQPADEGNGRSGDR